MSISQPAPPGTPRARRSTSTSSRVVELVGAKKTSQNSSSRCRRPSRPGRPPANGSPGTAGGSGDILDGGEPVLEPVAGPVDRDDVAVVQKPVEDGGGQYLVAEDLTPFTEAFV